MSESIPETMKAMVLTGHGDIDKLVFHKDWPTPKPGASEVLIKVGACGLNNTDVNTRSGWYSKEVSQATTGDAYEKIGEEDPSWGGAPLAFPRIQGADAAGTIVAVGAQVDEKLIGRRVITDNWLRDWDNPLDKNSAGYFGSEKDGGFAEYTTIDYRNAGCIECSLTDAELATFSCSYTTAEGMLERATVSSDDVVLITGASGGVGSAAVQLAKRRGATVVALAAEPKHNNLADIGADHCLSRQPENLKQALKEQLGQDSVSVVIDIVGGALFADVIECLSRGGHYACSGAIAGPIAELDLRTLYLNDLTFHGSTVVPPHIFKNLVSYIEKGEVKPLLAASYPLEQLHQAQQAFIEKKHTGNIAVTCA